MGKLAFRRPAALLEPLAPWALGSLIALGAWTLADEIDHRGEEAVRAGMEGTLDGLVLHVEAFGRDQLRSADVVAPELLDHAAQRAEEWGNIKGALLLAEVLRDGLAGCIDATLLTADGESVFHAFGREASLDLVANFRDHPDAGVASAMDLALSDVVREGHVRSPEFVGADGIRGFYTFQALRRQRLGPAEGLLALRFDSSAAAEACLGSGGLHLGGRNRIALVDPQGFVTLNTAPGSAPATWERAVERPVDFYGAPWRLRIAPARGAAAAGVSGRSLYVRGGGLVVGLALAALIAGLMRRSEALTAQGRKLSLALGASRLGVWQLDLERGELEVNPEWLEALGFRPHARVGLQDLLLRVPPGEVRSLHEEFDDLLAGRSEVAVCEHGMRVPAGRELRMRLEARVVERGEGGEALRLAGSQVDVTEERAYERALARTEQRHRAIFDHTPTGLLDLDLSRTAELLRALGDDGPLLERLEQDPALAERLRGSWSGAHANRALLELLGEQAPSGLEASLRRLLDPAGLCAMAETVRVLAGGVTDHEVDVPCRGAAGETLQYTVRSTLAPGAERDLSSVLVSVTDTTRRLREEEERRGIEERQRAVQKAESLSLLAGGVAHDFNNLLVPILGNLELALARLAGDSEGAAPLRNAHLAARRAADLARQMLTYSGRGKVIEEVFDLGAVVREMGGLLAAGMPTGVPLEQHVDAEPLWVLGDPVQFNQLLLNLVLNGAEAVLSAGRPGRVRLVATRGRGDRRPEVAMALGEDLGDRDVVVIRVTDDGVGMTPDQLQRVFEPFFSTKSTGRGLGMSVTQGIVRGHGGALFVHSEPGRGTRIDVHLPAMTEPVLPSRELQPHRRSVPGPVAGGARVLVADDEASVRQFARAALERYGVEVLEAEDGRDAVERFSRAPEGFAMVLLDVGMPGLGGIETLAALRALRPDLPAVLMSGYTDEPEVEAITALDGCAFLAKPFGLLAFDELVGPLLAGVAPALD